MYIKRQLHELKQQQPQVLCVSLTVVHQVSINSRKGDVESELAVVAPIIEAARLAVGQIKSDHLNEIRSLKAPPDAIRDVLEGVLKLMGQADTSWNSMKKFLGNRGIKVLQLICMTCERLTVL